MAEQQKRRRKPAEDLQNIPPLEDRRTADQVRGEQARQARETRQAPDTPPRETQQSGERRHPSEPATAIARDLQARIESAREAQHPTMQQISSANALIGQQIINTWLTEDFFEGTTHRSPGPTTRDRFIGANPRVITKPSNWFGQFEEETGFLPSGTSPTGGWRLADWLSGRDWERGDVFVSSSVLSTPDRYLLITHELLHTAVEANGGFDMYYVGEGGRRMSVGYVRWFHEGTTELFAQELVRAHGMEPNYVSYPYETMTCYLIQGILIEAYGETEGRRMMRDAYLNGDLSSIRNGIDNALGPGTFDRLMRMDRGIEGADEIFTLVRGKAGASILSFSGTMVTLGFADNPIVRLALRQLEQPQIQLQIHAFIRARERLSRERLSTARE